MHTYREDRQAVIHTYRNTQQYIHTGSNIYINKYTHTYIHTYTQEYIHTGKHMQARHA